MSDTITCNEVEDTDRESIKLIKVNLKEINDLDKQYIKDHLVAISKGKNSSYSSKTIAQKLKNMLEKQTEKNKYGLTAEFFQAVIIRNQNFEQKYSYSNLEENSAKKGFDGLYIKDSRIWLFESKSSYTYNSHKNKHKTTIDRAYSGISDMISGKTDNDPWENAESHVSRIDSEDSLISKLVQLSEEYTNDNFQDITESNIVLGSAVISENISFIETDTVLVQKYLIKHEPMAEIVIILNFTCPELFLDVLGEIANE